MRKLRVLIVDDEPLARERIRALLGESPSVDVIGECGDGTDALSVIRVKHPDIVFLDVQMPGCDCFQMLAELPVDQRPAIVIVTAHESFAVDAFAEQVVDYVLKPFDRQRLNIALRRAAESIRARRAEGVGPWIERVPAAAQAQQPERLTVRSDGRLIFVRPEDVLWVEATENYATLHLAGKRRLLVRETLASLEKRLGSSRFTRVSRSALVQLEQVQELQPLKYGDYTVLLQDGTRLPLSRNLRGQFAGLMADGV
jgi:two-component system, LytTR family, response regulator